MTLALYGLDPAKLVAGILPRIDLRVNRCEQPIVPRFQKFSARSSRYDKCSPYLTRGVFYFQGHHFGLYAGFGLDSLIVLL